MKHLYFDIETLPAPPELESLVRAQYDRVPDRAMSFEAYHRGTSLSGNFGQIFCIGYAVDDEPAQVLTGSEAEQLKQFWQIAKDIRRFVGHNLLEFDFPFVMKRSILYKIQPSRPVSFARYRQDPIYDTKKEWDSWAGGPATSLDTLAKIFGLETSKQGIDGSQVYDFWKDGRHQEIYDYCQRDVELTRKIYQRMTFQES